MAGQQVQHAVAVTLAATAFERLTEDHLGTIVVQQRLEVEPAAALQGSKRPASEHPRDLDDVLLCVPAVDP